MLFLSLKRNFSLRSIFFKSIVSISYDFPKIPKINPQNPNEKTKFSFENFFTKFFLSIPIENLSKELFDYLTNSQELRKNFPIITEDNEIYINFMTLHVYIIYSRFAKEESHFAKREADKLLFAFKSKYFTKFAEKINDFIPVQDFSSYFTENYNNRFKIIEKEFNQLYKESKNSHFSKEEQDAEMKKLIRKLIFFNKFPLKHTYIRKTLKYYEAHCNYLDSLPFFELLEYKIYWGFIDQKLLEEKDVLE